MRPHSAVGRQQQLSNDSQSKQDVFIRLLASEQYYREIMKTDLCFGVRNRIAASCSRNFCTVITLKFADRLLLFLADVYREIQFVM